MARGLCAAPCCTNAAAGGVVAATAPPPTVHDMTRLLSDFVYDSYTRPAGDLPLPALSPLSPLPPLSEPDGPARALPSQASTEALVRVAHDRVQVMSLYWRAGWRHARPGALVRAGVADRLYDVADALPPRLGLAVFDAWRPLELQQEIYDVAYADASLPPGFVTPPSADPAAPPPHLTGGTVDLTLTLDGVPLALGTTFDDFTDDARADSFEATPGQVRDLRRLLFHAMATVEFVVIDCEWWHFEYGTRRWSAITGGTPMYGPAAPQTA